MTENIAIGSMNYEVMRCTGRLRWLERTDGKGWWTQRVLQQEWYVEEMSAGKPVASRHEWRDVPVEKEDA